MLRRANNQEISRLIGGDEVVVNPLKSQLITFAADDQVLVLAES